MKSGHGTNEDIRRKKENAQANLFGWRAHDIIIGPRLWLRAPLQTLHYMDNRAAKATIMLLRGLPYAGALRAADCT
jgi:hypothetical protein